MKRVIAILLLTAVCLAAVGCSGGMPEGVSEDHPIFIEMKNDTDKELPLFISVNLMSAQAAEVGLAPSYFNVPAGDSTFNSVAEEEMAALSEDGQLTLSEPDENGKQTYELIVAIVACTAVTEEDIAADVAMADFVETITVTGVVGEPALLTWDGSGVTQ